MSPLHTVAFQSGLRSQSCASTEMLSITPSSMTTYELGPPPSEPSLSRITAVFQATLLPLSLAHLLLFAIGGNHTGLALTNFTRSTELLVVTAKLVYIR